LHRALLLHELLPLQALRLQIIANNLFQLLYLLL
jgi:hypothetical protein